ncbi:F-box/FBD/LRR-repeat protein At1g16930-like [Chenopodium quinoa]|uniref:F-box domain-containing protein n=1 Tax=Chenopodium quinoa TaxID=63459 RepID=A0A803MF00_CHEQI|nr:F-box/FBD/LRR-repeat protein At1g16930-like [Chenopodium quinoa]
MAENMHRHSLNPVRRHCRSSTDDGEDRLSSLPDPILTDILSRLPINSAASTSVLSRHWRHLWTGVTRFDLYNVKTPNPTDFLNNILQQLTSPKIDAFKIKVRSINSSYLPDELESCFHEICRRNVQQLIFNGEDYDYYIPIPACLLSCQSLVILELFGMLEFERWNKDRVVKLQLPNLKKLSLRSLHEVPTWLGSLSESSPLLEDLTLMFDLDQPYFGMPILNLNFPNLKTLKLEVRTVSTSRVSQISIDAPKLTHLEIGHSYDCTLPYTFRSNPTALVEACIDLKREEEEDEFDFDDEEEFHRFSEFFRGMYSISNLKILVERHFNIFVYLCVNVNQPIFFNLVRLKTTLLEFDLNDCKDLLVSLQCFPNLKHLWVKLYDMDYCSKMGQRNLCAPDIVPSCLISKLKTIKIKGLRLSGSIGVLKLLGYILGNAKVLEKLYLDAWFDGHSEQEKLWKEREFCISLFKLPRSSSTCDVEFSGRFIRSSSDLDFKNGKLICKVH